MLIFYGATVPWTFTALGCAAIGKRPMHAVIGGWVGFHTWCVRHILGIRVKVEGHPPAGQHFYAAKHQSMFETLYFLNALDEPLPVLKKELTDIPFWGWLAKHYGGISVDRSRGAAMLREMLVRTRMLLKSGRSVLIFPEGTRVPLGETPPLQAGFAGLYKMLRLPVVPVAVESGHVWPRDGWIKRPGVVTIRYFDPIPAGLPRDEVEAIVYRQINALEFGGD